MDTIQLLIVSIFGLLGLIVTGCVAVIVTAARYEGSAPAEPASQAPQDDAQTLAPSRVGHRVTVHTKKPDDLTYYGVIEAEFADRLTLTDGALVDKAGEHPLPGVQHIRQADIAWIDDKGDVTLPAFEVERLAEGDWPEPDKD